ncbi:hypothetical protein ACU610_21275 [Geodermatophilus sp. URMC 61]|uniref:hypothetical protein n=1 Tax=Geodermatophilus sp. URMC 61 TaxID=3423411 RepID=UPI00406D2778
MNEQDLDRPTHRRPKKTKGRRRAAKQSGGIDTPVTAGSFAHRAPAVFVARESDLYGHMLLSKMVEQTLDPFMHIPAVQAAAALGVTPLLRTPEGDRVREELNARLLYPSDGSGRRFFGVRFEIDGYAFQYGLTTGAGATLQGDNDWVESLVELLEDYRPAKLIAGPAARLARIEPLFVRLEAPLKAARTAVVTAETPEGGLDLRTQAGLDNWRTLARAAQADYHASVLRMFTGVVYEIKNNRYPRSPIALYPGYLKRGGKKDDRNDVLLDDSPETKAFVRRFIELAASDATDDEIVADLTPLGLRSRHPQLVAEGRNAPEHVDDPRRMLRSLYPALRTYRDGTYLFQHEMPLPDYDKIHGFDVFRTNPHDPGFIQKVLQFPLPDGGWHDSALIEEAIRLRDPDPDPNATVAAPLTRDTVKPLAGLFRWTDAGHEYCLLANDAESYELRRRPAPGATKASGGRRRFDPNDGELVGRFDAGRLHLAVAQLLRRLGEGVPAALPCPAAPLPSDRLLTDLRQQRDDAQRQADAARQEVLRASNEDEKEEYRELGKEQQQEVRRLNAEIAREEAKRRPVPRTTHDGTRIAALVKILEDLPGAADTAVARALRGLVRGARILDAGPTRPLARVEMTLAIRTDTGSLNVGPISEPVKNRAVGGMPGTDPRRQGFARRNVNLLEALLLEGATEDERKELWETEGFTARSYTRRMFAALEPVVGGQVASALIHCPIIDSRRAALEPYLRHGIPLGDGFAPELAEELPRIYVPTGFSWTNGWCPGGMARERQVLALIDRYATVPDDGLATAEVKQGLAIDDTALYRMAHEGNRPYGRPNAKPSPAPWYARVEILPGPGGPRSLGSRVRIRRCPHCGERKLLQPLRVPEVAGYLLCVNCRRSLRSAVRYPDEFFLPWDGPQSLTRRRPDAGTASEKVWFSTSGRIIVGTSLCTVHVPSLHAPRRRK